MRANSAIFARGPITALRYIAILHGFCEQAPFPRPAICHHDFGPIYRVTTRHKDNPHQRPSASHDHDLTMPATYDFTPSVLEVSQRVVACTPVNLNHPPEHESNCPIGISITSASGPDRLGPRNGRGGPIEGGRWLKGMAILPYLRATSVTSTGRTMRRRKDKERGIIQHPPSTPFS